MWINYALEKIEGILSQKRKSNNFTVKDDVDEEVVL